MDNELKQAVLTIVKSLGHDIKRIKRIEQYCGLIWIEFNFEKLYTLELNAVQLLKC